MRILAPSALAALGLGTGLAAGLALKPEPVTVPDACAPPCLAAEADSRLEKIALSHNNPGSVPVYVAFDQPFVVPVFESGRVAAMVVVSVSLEAGGRRKAEAGIRAAEPRLRDSLLKAMFRHANSDGFGGSFTSGRQMDDLKSALLSAANGVMSEGAVREVLITGITRQEL